MKPAKPHNTTKPIALVVLPFLCIYAFAALGMAFFLTLVVFTAYAHGVKIDPSQVLLIGGFASSGGTALGIVGGSMIQTEKPQPTTNIDHADNAQTGGPNTNTASPQTPIAPE